MSKKFADALTSESNWGKTWNGQDAYLSTLSDTLDFYASFGTYRGTSAAVKTSDFDAAYKEEALLAMKTLFYGRDVRGGLGERKTFRDILHHAGDYQTASVIKNISLIPYFGRFDDLYALVGTKAEDEMWKFMSAQFEADVVAMQENKPASLLAKWIKTPDSANEKTAELGKLTAKKLGYARNKMPLFKKTLKALRKYIGVVEPYVYGGNFDLIDYSKMPGMAMLRYKKLFQNKDTEHFSAYLESLSKGETKMNTSVMTPYDVAKGYIEARPWNRKNPEIDEAIEEAWKNLPNYIDAEKMHNTLIVCDTSGSMWGRKNSNCAIPMTVALSLTLYAAERNTGEFHNKFVTFSNSPKFQSLKGETLIQRLSTLNTEGWAYNTNIEAVMQLLLNTAKKHHIAPEEMPSSILIISDMEFDACATGTTFTSHFKKKFASEGYTLPNVIFWNVNTVKSVFHADKNEAGVQLVSGYSPAVFTSVIQAMNMTPMEAMISTLSNPRYDCIQV